MGSRHCLLFYYKRRLAESHPLLYSSRPLGQQTLLVSDNLRGRTFPSQTAREGRVGCHWSSREVVGGRFGDDSLNLLIPNST